MGVALESGGDHAWSVGAFTTTDTHADTHKTQVPSSMPAKEHTILAHI